MRDPRFEPARVELPRGCIAGHDTELKLHALFGKPGERAEVQVQRMGTGRAAYATVCFPVIALMASALWEGFVWAPLALVGLGLTLAGNAVMFLPARRAPVQPASASSA